MHPFISDIPAAGFGFTQPFSVVEEYTHELHY
jgi:hypothetical protein